MVALTLWYDLRAPSWAAMQHPELYAACLEQVAWAEKNGVADIAVLSEHHGREDGFMPSPLTLAAAIAARTQHIPINIAAIVLPLHDPIRLAEQAAAADLISRGRISFVVAIGYAEHEFEMAGVDRSKRVQLLEEYIDVMRKAWTGEPFEWQGRTIRVTPTPYTKPHPPMFMGGGAKASALRAARLRMPFLPSLGDPELKRVYDEESARIGYQGMCVLPVGPGMVHVTEDPEKAWNEMKRYAMFDAQSYAEMQTSGNRSMQVSDAKDPDELLREGIYRIVTPDECVALAEELGPAGTIIMRPLMSGMPAEMGWESLELMREKVLPRIRPA
jgi:alkanesulfonate monooxygenase SsuD/methylene tetrahydromethanopterin reductase-like flavin-dependent oxidoreductase (luciferase family)